MKRIKVRGYVGPGSAHYNTTFRRDEVITITTSKDSTIRFWRDESFYTINNISCEGKPEVSNIFDFLPIMEDEQKVQKYAEVFS